MKKFDNLESEFEDLKKSLLSTTSTKDLLAKIEAIEKSVSDLNSDVADVSQNVSDVETSLQSLASVAALDESVVHIEEEETITGAKTFDSAVSSSLVTTTYLKGNQGNAIINSTAAAGKYTMLDKLNSTNGYFTDGVYGVNRQLNYTTADTVTSEKNARTYYVTLLNESGQSLFRHLLPLATGTYNLGTATYQWKNLYLSGDAAIDGTVTATTFSGDLSGNADTATTATQATQDGDGNTISEHYVTLSSAQEISGVKTITAEPENSASLWVSRSTGDTYVGAKRTDTNVGVRFGVGTGGTNHGLWSDALNKWMVYGNGSSVFLNGNATTATTATTATKVSNALTITDEDTSLSQSFDGSASVSLDLSPYAKTDSLPKIYLHSFIIMHKSNYAEAAFQLFSKSADEMGYGGVASYLYNTGRTTHSAGIPLTGSTYSGEAGTTYPYMSLYALSTTMLYARYYTGAAYGSNSMPNTTWTLYETVTELGE